MVVIALVITIISWTQAQSWHAKVVRNKLDYYNKRIMEEHEYKHVYIYAKILYIAADVRYRVNNCTDNNIHKSSVVH